ncbi:MAG TPA: hypothetical protein VHX44_18295 [Planctomycetota bacterium]|nr:hypothetical protein [Planctomycetota bacterium]
MPFFGNRSPKQPSGSSGGTYSVDERDTVQSLAGFAQPSDGAPLPVVVASEHVLSVVFYLQQTDPSRDGTSCRVVSSDTDDEPVGVASFDGVCAHFFGPPNDEAFAGHPLSERGLKPYGAFEVFSSSWIRNLQKMNAVHPYHRPERFASLRHFILTFHDSIFECVARGYRVEQPAGSLRSVVSGLVSAM